VRERSGGARAGRRGRRLRDQCRPAPRVRDRGGGGPAAVNRLLDEADPILDAYHDHRITPAVAAQRMGVMEQEFAALAVEMDTITPANPALARINAPYAHTYVLEDSYLATLASDLGDGTFANLPNTQYQQRLAIIEWRTELQVAALRAGYELPADLQQAGRGEIAPGPNGS
jgi:hypothetical protein